MINFKTVLAFGVGVAAGLWLAKQYVRNEISDTIHRDLDSIGLGGGKVEAVIQDLGRYIDGTR